MREDGGRATPWRSVVTSSLLSLFLNHLMSVHSLMTNKVRFVLSRSASLFITLCLTLLYACRMSLNLEA